MTSVLEELFHGNIQPSEKITFTSEYKKLRDEVYSEMEKFENKLSKDDFTRLEELRGLISRLDSIESEQYFAFGFKLATLIMIEVFTAKEKLCYENS